jgi:hypothetical protein
LISNRGKFARNGVGTITFGGEGGFLFPCADPACVGYLQYLSVCGGKASGTLVGLHSRRGKLSGKGLSAVAFLFKCLLVFYLGCLNAPRGLLGNPVRVVEFCPDNGQFTREGLCSVSLLLELLLERLPLLEFHCGGIGDIRADVRLELISNGCKFARTGVGTVTFGSEGDFLFGYAGPARLGYLQYLGVCGSKACGTLVGLRSHRGKLAGEHLNPVARFFTRLRLLPRHFDDPHSRG